MEQNNQYNTDTDANPYQGAVVSNQLDKKKDNSTICSLVFGILSIFFCWSIAIPMVLGLAGLIMGIVSLVRTKPVSGIALAGTITSAAGLVLSAGVLLFLILII